MAWDSRLVKIALAYSDDMARNDHYSRVNRARKAGYGCNNLLGIDVAEHIHLPYGHVTMLYGRSYQWESQERMVERFVADWIASPEHCRNILDPSTARPE